MLDPGWGSPHCASSNDLVVTGARDAASGSSGLSSGSQTPTGQDGLQPIYVVFGGQSLAQGLNAPKFPTLNAEILQQFVARHSEMRDNGEGATLTIEEPRHAPPHGQKHARDTPTGSENSEISIKRVCQATSLHQNGGR